MLKHFLRTYYYYTSLILYSIMEHRFRYDASCNIMLLEFLIILLNEMRDINYFK